MNQIWSRHALLVALAAFACLAIMIGRTLVPFNRGNAALFAVSGDWRGGESPAVALVDPVETVVLLLGGTSSVRNLVSALKARGIYDIDWMIVPTYAPNPKSAERLMTSVNVKNALFLVNSRSRKDWKTLAEDICRSGGAVQCVDVIDRCAQSILDRYVVSYSRNAAGNVSMAVRREDCQASAVIQMTPSGILTLASGQSFQTIIPDSTPKTMTIFPFDGQ